MKLQTMPLKLQVKLLSVIQDNEVTRLGGTRPKKVNVRIIAATNQNLEDGKGREIQGRSFLPP
jgi:transcriptional regulator with PAS, ATPase and Fis domain